MKVKKTKIDMVLDNLADLDDRVRKIEIDLSATKKALTILIWIGRILAIVAGIIGNVFMFGRGRSGKRGKK